MEALKCVKVPDKLSEVLGDVLELACGPEGGSAASRIGAITGVAIIRGRWTQRGQARAASSSSSTTQDSQDSAEVSARR